MAAEEIERIYRRISQGKGEAYIKLFALQSFFAGCMEFDPVTNEPLQTTIDDILYAVSRTELPPAWWDDRFQHIINFSSTAIYALLDFLHEKNLREHRTSRPERVREIDSQCMMWLAKKPGFTIKQKIASEQRMMGVYHTTSIDTAENRLLKAFLLKVDDILFEKERAAKSLNLKIPEEMRRLISTVHSWTYSDECAQIASWNNVPPNNTLLNDKNYRKIWKAWLSLQTLSEQIASDLKHLPELKSRALLLLTAARLHRSAFIRFRQTALFPDYEKLNFSDTKGQCAFCGWCKNSAQGADWQKISVSEENNSVILKVGDGQTAYSHSEYGSTLSEIFAFSSRIAATSFPTLSFESVPEEKSAICALACVDLNAVRPSFTRSDGRSVVQNGTFSEKLLFQSQQPSEGDKPIFYSCAKSKYIWSKRKALKTLSLRNIFDRALLSDSDSEKTLPIVEKACADFVRVIRTQLHSQNCLYVTSDDIDDFSPSVNAFKRSMNVAFVRTEILPRSIAAVFSRLGEIKMKFKHGDIITVRDSYDGYDVITKLKVVVDDELLTKNPETNGFQFQRLSHHRTDKKNPSPVSVPKNLVGVLSARDAELLDGAFSADDFHFENATPSKMPQAPSENEIVITAHDDTSPGALVYRRLQDITPGIYLWCDFLPKLSMVDASGKEYVLVEPSKERVQPVVGKPVSINISWKFSFPAKKAFYEFPLMQGEKKEKSDYFAFIKDSSFPLENETECRLHLTYTYGKDYPYNLEFIPVADGAEFKTVTVKWENKSHRDFIHDMPVPNFVREYTWEDMRAVKKRDSDETSDIIGNWLPKEYAKIITSGVFVIKNKIPSKKAGTDVFFLHGNLLDELGRRVLVKDPICYIPSKQGGQIGNLVWCYLEKTPKGIQAFDPHIVGKNSGECSFSKSLRFPALTVWNNGRSISDNDCPVDFRKQTLNIITKLRSCFGLSVPESVKHEQMFFLSCLHKDAPVWFVKVLPKVLDVIDQHFDYPNWIAYALGDCSTEWQKDLLAKTLALLDDKTKSVYAVKILAKALWRVNNFVFNLSEKEVKKMLPVIKRLLDSKQSNPQETTAVHSACMECLVALCRLRCKENGESASESMLSTLSPVQNPEIKEIITSLEKMKKNQSDVLTRKNGVILSVTRGNQSAVKTFLTFEIDRPDSDKTPELLYVAHGYVSGQIDGNAIRVLEADFSD